MSTPIQVFPPKEAPKADHHVWAVVAILVVIFSVAVLVQSGSAPV